MSSFPKFLSKNLNLNLETKIEQIIKKNEKFFFLDQRSNQFGPFDFIILAIPPIQAIELLKNQNFSFNENLKNVKMSGCFSLMACFKEIPKNFKKTFDIALIKNPSVLSMICFNDSKPSRNKDQICITSLSKNSFADHHIEINSDSSEIKEILKLETSRILNFNLDNADLIDMQQFKFANIAKKNKEKALIDYENNIAVCGDWEFGGRVECAFLSGLRIANLLKKHFV
jgi:predicted NAD/FAD-dependent oxidoreductase